MNLLWVTDHYAPYGVGGSAESVRLLAVGMVARGHRVTLVTPAWGTGHLSDAMEGGVRVVRVPVPGALPTWATAPPTGFVWGLTRAIARVVCRFAPTADLVHAQDRRVLPGAMLGARDRPVLLTLRDVGLLCPIVTCLLDQRTVPEDCGQRRLWRTCGPGFARRYGGGGLRQRGALATRYALLATTRARARRRLSGAAYVSEGLRRVYDAIGALRGVPKAVVLSPVVSGAGTVLGTGTEPYVLYVGKPSPGKGWTTVLSMSRSGEPPAPARIAVLSPAPPESMPDRMMWVGSGNVRYWMRGAAAVLVPSVNCDALPRVALEAAAEGRCVIGSRVGGIPEIIRHDETGILVPPGNPVMLAAAIRWVIGHPARAEAMGRAARKDVLERFSPEQCAIATEEFYRTVKVP